MRTVDRVDNMFLWPVMALVLTGFVLSFFLREQHKCSDNKDVQPSIPVLELPQPQDEKPDVELPLSLISTAGVEYIEWGPTWRLVLMDYKEWVYWVSFKNSSGYYMKFYPEEL